MKIEPETWPTLSKLLDEWLDLPEESRSSWLESLAPEYAPLLPTLRELMENHKGAGSAGFLDTLPKVTQGLESFIPMSLSIGTRLGPYEILAPLGAGGMGEVYRAQDTKLKRDVALKVLPEALARDPDRMARFQREAEVLASLNHPNIAAIYGLEGNALVMELVEGETLAEKIKQAPLPIETALNYAKQIAEALEAAHEKGITHRDLKPSNVMITRESVVKVLDFGIAAQSRDGEAASSTRPGMIMGTVAYMSPEQARGEAADRRADIWAFGAVLYEMLTGKRAFTGETASDLLAAVLNSEPDLEAIPLRVRKLVAQCLTKDRKLRLQAIGDWRLLMEDGTAPGLTSGAIGLAWPGWVAAAALAVIAVVLGFALWRATRPVDRPLMRFSADLGPDAVEGVNITAAISPDGRRLAFVARGPGGKQQLATRLLDEPKAALLGGTENAAEPFFSPDGQWLGFFADGKMKKISVQGGAAVTLCDTPDPHGGGAVWGEDGFIIVTLTTFPGSGLSRVPASGGTPQAITKPAEKGEGNHLFPQILPGGQAVLFTRNTNTGGDIEVLALKSGQRKAVQHGGRFGRYLPSGYLVYLQQRTLFAVGFDLDRLEIRGAPVPLLEDVAGRGWQYDVARNGTLVYLSGKPSNESWPVAWMDSSGKTQPLPAAPGLYFTPRFSPDGKRLALTLALTVGAVGLFNLGDIHVYDWQRDRMTRLTFTQANTFPVWTPDGKHIVFRSQALGARARFSLHWIRADGAGEAQPLLESKGTLIPYSFSPDGQRLAFAEFAEDTSFDIWTLPLDVNDPEHPKPGKPELFLRTPFDDREPAFSPDGRWIAYSSQESGRFEVYVRPFPGGARSASVKWQISTGGGLHPIWSRAGRELFYETLDNRIMVSTYTAKADSFAVDKPRLWSSTQILEAPGFSWNLDLAPDGKRFAVLPRPDATGEQKGSVHVTVLLNFFDELRRRVPAGGK
jgi:Tol biopolymer transport system component/predicted Ser/Thr protein kinase